MQGLAAHAVQAPARSGTRALLPRQSASTLSPTLVVYEVQTGAMLLVQALLSLSRDGFVTIALLFYLVYLNWKLTLIVGVMVPGVAWIMKVLSKRLYHLTRLGQHATDELAYVVEENVPRPQDGAPAPRRSQPERALRTPEPQPQPPGREVDHRLEAAMTPADRASLPSRCRSW